MKSRLKDKKPFLDWNDDINLVNNIYNYETKEKIEFKNNIDIDNSKFLRFSLPTLESIKRGESLGSEVMRKPGMDQKINLIK